MRKLVNTLVFIVISLVSTAAVAPQAQAYAQYGTETYYYHYGAQQATGSEAYLCAIQWAWGDRTGSFGDLKQVITWKCDTGEYTEQWYRYAEVDCVNLTLGWYPIAYPYYSNQWIC